MHPMLHASVLANHRLRPSGYMEIAMPLAWIATYVSRPPVAYRMTWYLVRHFVLSRVVIHLSCIPPASRMAPQIENLTNESHRANVVAPIATGIFARDSTSLGEFLESKSAYLGTGMHHPRALDTDWREKRNGDTVAIESISAKFPSECSLSFRLCQI